MSSNTDSSIELSIFVSSSNVSSLHQALSSVLQDPTLSFNIGGEFDVGALGILPFKKLVVKRKLSNKIVTDGLDPEVYNSLDFSAVNDDCELSPDVWHHNISNHDEKKVVLDIRNDYESDVGIFVNSIPLNTSKYVETWNYLDLIVDNLPKDTKIYTFCTGGVRCVKVAAYLKQKKGFDNVYRLKDGIIGYQRWLSSSPGNLSESLFKGKNFLFDRRRDVM